MTQNSVAFNAALEVTQDAVKLLAQWAEFDLRKYFVDHAIDNQEKLFWSGQEKLQALRLLFDHVKLEQGQNKKHYCEPKAIEDSQPTIPYPLEEIPSDEKFNQLKLEIRIALDKLDKEDWNNLDLLSGSFISFGKDDDIAFVDIARTTAAITAVISTNNQEPNLSLIAGDLSGIQKFIYTIASDGALKSLRARSFYLEIVTEEVVQRLLEKLQLPRTNVIYAGGGNLYILADGTGETKKSVKEVSHEFNQWLLDEFEGKIFLALDLLKFPKSEISNSDFSNSWSEINKILAKQKSQKFSDEIETSGFIQPSYSHEPCRVCHRDDKKELKQLNSKEPDSVLACEFCHDMFDLGSKLFKVNAIIRSKQKELVGSLDTLEIGGTYYHLFENWKQINLHSETVILINDWTIEHYQFKHFPHAFPLLLGNYGKQSEDISEESKEPKGFISAEEMVKAAKGIPRVGYLRMDVDNLGKIFAKGLKNQTTLARLAGLSRQMSYFFKVYLNSLASDRKSNVPSSIKLLNPEANRLNLLFIYAGGDDLFISGAWNEIVEFSFDIYQCFRAYTGYNSDITLSGGISIYDSKFPLYQAAESSGDAEDLAKANGRDSLGLFAEVFKWDEWLGMKNVEYINIDAEVKKYLDLEPKARPSLLGILPFVEKLEQQKTGLNYSRSFVRNLLITAQIQKKALEKFKEDKTSEEALATRYYLHLPKVAYTLSRLPKTVLDDDDFRTSLKSPYNAPYFRAIATWIEFLNRS